MSEASDEAQIRQLVTSWIAANAAGDVDAVLKLMTEDVVFLTPGHAPMSKQRFAEIARTQAGTGGASIKGSSEIQEVKVLGDWAFMWTRLSVVATPKDGTGAIERSGHTLTILRKEQGQWLLARDANLLTAQRGNHPDRRLA